MEHRDFKTAKKWVVKVGSAVIVRDGVRIDRPTFASLVEGMAQLREADTQLTVVTSGAVALGCQRLGIERQRSIVLPRLQALAALGQSQLIQWYDREFDAYGLRVAQLLLGRADLDRRTGYLNARNALEAVHRFGAVPVINENDTIATEELRFGDNDQLAAMVCGLAGADLLVLLSDVEGVFDVVDVEDGAPVFGERFREIATDDPRLDVVAGPSRGRVGTGGMVSKVAAARIAARFGVPTIIAPGKSPRILARIAAGDDVGTLLYPPDVDTLQGRKVWLQAGALTVGAIVCDSGAARAVRNKGASLLPSGVVSVEGAFDEGAVVEIRDEEGVAFARGVSAYASEDIEKIRGQQSGRIEDILGFRGLDCVVHRDDMVVDES